MYNQSKEILSTSVMCTYLPIWFPIFLLAIALVGANQTFAMVSFNVSLRLKLLQYKTIFVISEFILSLIVILIIHK